MEAWAEYLIGVRQSAEIELLDGLASDDGMLGVDGIPNGRVSEV